MKTTALKKQKITTKTITENNMKNILGKTEGLTLYNKEGKRVYEFDTYSDRYSSERTYDSNGNELTYKNSDGYSSESTYDSNGKELTYKDSNGVSIGFDIPEFTMEDLVSKLGNFKLKK